MEQLRNDIRIDITIPSDTSYLGMIGRMGENLGYALKLEHDIRQDLPYNLNLVLSEAVANAIDHGNQNNPDKPVRVLLTVSGQDLTIRIYDQGQGFDMSQQSDKKTYKEDESGRGVHLIRKLMDRVECHQEAGGTVLTLTKYL